MASGYVVQYGAGSRASSPQRRRRRPRWPAPARSSAPRRPLPARTGRARERRRRRWERRTRTQENFLTAGQRCMKRWDECAGGPAPQPSRSTEDSQHALGEQVVEAGDDGHHDRDEDHDHGGVRDQLMAGRPDHFAELRDDLTVEQRQPAPWIALTAAEALAATRGQGPGSDPVGRRGHAPARLGHSPPRPRPVVIGATPRRNHLPASPGRDVGPLAGATGLEPATTGFGDRDSAKLSYAPSPGAGTRACAQARVPAPGEGA